MNNIMKFASLLAAAVMLVSCTGTSDDGGEGGGGSVNAVLKIEPDKTLFQSDGVDYVTLKVTLDGVAVEDDVVFYQGKNPVTVKDFKFFTTSAGDYEIWASHGIYVSDPVTLRAISVPIPETPKDSKPSSTEFKSRVMCMQFTGTACGYCSQFMSRLKDAFDKESLKDEYVKASIHNYQYVASNPDAAFLQWEWASQNLKVTDLSTGKIGKVTNPSIIMDYAYGYYLYNSISSTEFESYIHEMNENKEDEACGIAVNAKLADGQVVAKVTVKAAVDGSYRVGAMLLEDGISGKQINGEEWMNTHDGCVRHIDARYKSDGKESYYGHSLGTVEAGKTADYIFIWNLDDIKDANDPNNYWDEFVEENLRIAVFVTSAKDDAYYINNAVQTKLNTSIPFEYR